MRFPVRRSHRWSRSHARMVRAPTHRLSPVAFVLSALSRIRPRGLPYIKSTPSPRRRPGPNQGCITAPLVGWRELGWTPAFAGVTGSLMEGVLENPGPERRPLDAPGWTQRPMREPVSFDGLGTEFVPQQSGLFLGLLAFVRRFPPRIRGRKYLRALPLGRELSFPRHGRSPERSVFFVLGASTWREVNATRQFAHARRGYDGVARWLERKKGGSRVHTKPRRHEEIARAAGHG